MTINDIVKYVMDDPLDTNRVILIRLLNELENEPEKEIYFVEDIVDYVMNTRYNTNRQVLISMLRLMKGSKPPQPITKRTVLYNDGTFIINELSTDIEKNIEKHGSADYVYDPLDDTHDYYFQDATGRPWHNERLLVASVEIGSSIFPTSTAYWFAQFTNCTSIDLANLDTSNTIYMNNMFGACSSLQSVDVSRLNTSNTTTMRYMFANCTSLEELNLTGFDTSKTTDMYGMFFNDSSLVSLDLTSFDTSQVTTMRQMFDICLSLTQLDLSTFDTLNVTNMYQMFQRCSLLQTIYTSPLFVTTNVTESTSMFVECINLVGGAGTRYDGSYQNNKEYARIDNPPTAPGYFTLKE